MKVKSDEAEGNADALIALLRRPGRWVTNAEIVRALGLTTRNDNKAVIWHWTDAEDWIGPDDTRLSTDEDGFKGHTKRLYSKRAVVACGLRTHTPNGKAFRIWAAGFIAEAMSSNLEFVVSEREAFAQALSKAVIDLLEGKDVINA